MTITATQDTRTKPTAPATTRHSAHGTEAVTSAATLEAAPEAAGGEAVVVRGLRRAFDNRVVLDGIDLIIAPGEFVALLGRSGSGKSTLLRAVGGLDADYEGDALVPTRRSIVFQEPRLLPWARTLPNVTVGLPRALAPRGAELLAEVGLTDHARAWPVTLSGGEAQRVALARALVREPELLLLDEPFGALDALTRIRMHALLRALCDRYRPAVLLVTHDVDEAILLADRILVLTDGRIGFDEHVDIAAPRLRTDPSFGILRARLLSQLGVDEAA
jgi:sulfonate transport system ATP-binding protein